MASRCHLTRHLFNKDLIHANLSSFGIFSVTDATRLRLINSMLTQLENPDVDERVLIRRAQTGCRESMEALVRRYQLDLRQFLVRRTGNRTIADDIAQEVMVTAIQQLGQLQEASAFKSWLWTMARNKTVDYLRKLSRERKNNQQMLEFMIMRQAVSSEGHAEFPESSEIRVALRQCIAALPSRSQQLLNAFYFDSQSAESIAVARSQKSSSIRMALLRIRQALAQCIRQRTGSEL